MRRDELARLGDLNLESGLSPAAFPRELIAILRMRTAGQGERRLALAVLLEAAQCLEKQRRDFPSRLARWEAGQWFASERCDALFCFENVCAILGLNARAIRGRVLSRRTSTRTQKEAPPPSLLECTLSSTSPSAIPAGASGVRLPVARIGPGHVIAMRKNR